MINIEDTMQFKLPQELACIEPSEVRGIERDDVRLLVTKESGEAHHSTFLELDKFLNSGDALVVNTSSTLPASIPFHDEQGNDLRLHFSTRISKTEWLIEIREVKDNKTIRWYGGKKGMLIDLPNDGQIELISQFYEDRSMLNLWIATWHSKAPLHRYLNNYGQPIKYENLDQPYPVDYYQTLFSTHPGSSEMPSAGRGFTLRLLNKLLRKGVQVAPILLHTGVSSLEENESPYPEYMEVDRISASVINNARADGKKVIAVGTTAIRALETANDGQVVIPFRGYTDLYITGDHQMKVANGMITGFHEPKASHLHMLQSIAGQDHVQKAYNEAIIGQYFWHQFGDLHLILP